MSHTDLFGLRNRLDLRSDVMNEVMGAIACFVYEETKSVLEDRGADHGDDVFFALVHNVLLDAA